MIDIVIPTRTDEYVVRLMQSIATSQPDWAERSRIIVADNGLSYQTRQLLAHKWPEPVFVTVPNPFIFAAAVNLGAREMREDADVMILNDDTEIISPLFLERLDLRLHQRDLEHYGILSPRLTGGAGNQDLLKELAWDEVLITRTTIPFIAPIIRRRLWEPMDERYVGYGSDDDDTCRRVVEAGYLLGVTGAAVINHYQHGTYQKQHSIDHWTELYHVNRKLFEEKWKVEPGTPHLGAYGKP